MPPELFHRSQTAVILGEAGCSATADSWALGCVLYFAFYGKPRFHGSIEEVREQWVGFAEEDYHVAKVHFLSQQLADERDEGKQYEDLACTALLCQLLSLGTVSAVYPCNAISCYMLTSGAMTCRLLFLFLLLCVWCCRSQRAAECASAIACSLSCSRLPARAPIPALHSSDRVHPQSAACSAAPNLARERRRGDSRRHRSRRPVAAQTVQLALGAHAQRLQRADRGV